MEFKWQFVQRRAFRCQPRHYHYRITGRYHNPLTLPCVDQLPERNFRHCPQSAPRYGSRNVSARVLLELGEIRLCDLYDRRTDLYNDRIHRLIQLVKKYWPTAPIKASIISFAVFGKRVAALSLYPKTDCKQNAVAHVCVHGHAAQFNY
ncbi:hypothetical protein EVAR_8211_1 [Eumeta japonica]|uniref:Uncharacterized protein n=1 Tax=Eumeta variegata TaxID=151549 RepID=A0A4C1TIR6_EUMVA|nr:hypothetical protein EVAR_8211_1 [Eumeta japonica]